MFPNNYPSLSRLHLYVLITLFSYFDLPFLKVRLTSKQLYQCPRWLTENALLPVAVLSFQAKSYLHSKLLWLLALILPNQKKILLIFDETRLGVVSKITHWSSSVNGWSFYCTFLVAQKRKLVLSSARPKDSSRARECVIAKHVFLSNRSRGFAHMPFRDLSPVQTSCFCRAELNCNLVRL